jgi:hypothetical protein
MIEVESTKKEYTLKELIDFGNYLLSKERNSKKITKMNEVWDADIQNWIHKCNDNKLFIS